ncbi:hypothetical protein [Capnocytophaga canis]|uniref:hypothetical protein n=1 Tax=Capnocytophaga canis TaxID=1848903 RepID=UPI0015620871|nr:hypothetical protein [Capnocytophaga canis]
MSIILWETLPIILLVLTAISVVGCNQEKKNDLQEAKLKGKVKSVSQKVYKGSEKFGEVQKDSAFCGLFNAECNTTYYNEFGNKTAVEYETYFLGKEVFTYDVNQFLVTIEHFDQKGKLKQKGIYLNNEIGKPFEMNTYEGVEGTFDSKKTMKYDAKNNVIETCKYDANGNLKTKEECKYDEKENLIEKRITNSEVGYIYEDGKIVEEPLSEKYTYLYDEKGNKIEENIYKDNNILHEKWTFKYDNKGNQIEQQLFSNKDNIKAILEYDSEGNPIKKSFLDNFGDIFLVVTSSYTYDKYKNWIRHIIYKNKKIERIVEREIEYYE